MPPRALPAGPVAVVGAGFLGAEVAAALARVGVPVLATTRTGTWPNKHVPENISLSALDVLADDPREIAQTLAPARALVVCYAPGRTQDRRDLYV
ncbi:MAG TPA: hypothetical protein VIK91_23205, partial [Nannocystis sp.]